ncbi:MAG: prolyl oligopeptidase family serine peptidase, partial [Planctomycetota bacterium]
MLRTCLCVVVLAGSTVAAAGGDLLRDHDITSDDYFTIGIITDAVMSPDGKYVAYSEMRWEPPAAKRNTDLWVVECATQKVTRLTFDRAADRSPKWSPDGRWIYFAASRKQGGETVPPYNDQKQVWRVSSAGGPIFAVTRLEEGIQQFELSADGRTLYYTVGDKQRDEQWKELQEKHEHIAYGWGVVTFSQLWQLDLTGWRSQKLVDEKRVIRDFTVAPDERRVAMITTPTEEPISHEGRSRVDVFDRPGGKVTSLPDRQWRDEAPSPYGWIESPAWSADGRALAFGVDFDAYPAEIFVARWDGQEITIQKVGRPEGVSAKPSRLQWRGESQDLCFIGEHRARARVYCVPDVRDGQQGDVQVLTPGDVCVGALTLSRGGERLAVVMSTVTHPPDVFLMPAGSDISQRDYTRLTRVNPQVDTWRLPQIQLVTWQGYNGDEVEGILELPPDYEPGAAPLPLIVHLHGGPTASSLYRLRFWIYGRVLLAARGYALLSPNYRGSTGYGDKFLTDLVGHKNHRDVADILAGVDTLIERGIADPDRLGVMGWSNGGYLTNCLITKTDRFKAASSGAGVVDV